LVKSNPLKLGPWNTLSCSVIVWSANNVGGLHEGCQDLGTVLFGWIWFGGLPFDWLNVLGQLLGFVGSGLYAYCKLKGK
jgi:solute carrier family 35 protein